MDPIELLWSAVQNSERVDISAGRFARTTATDESLPAACHSPPVVAAFLRDALSKDAHRELDTRASVVTLIDRFGERYRATVFTYPVVERSRIVVVRLPRLAVAHQT